MQATADPWLDNPFGGGTRTNTKESTATAASFIEGVSDRLKAWGSSGAKSGGVAVKFVAELFTKLFDLVKQAAHIAVSKFLVELCAMVISSIGAALAKKYTKPLDITTGGVFYNSQGQPQAQTSAQSQQQGNLWGGSAFDSGWSNSRNSW